jgi:hypothetical protein
MLVLAQVSAPHVDVDGGGGGACAGLPFTPSTAPG